VCVTACGAVCVDVFIAVSAAIFCSRRWGDAKMCMMCKMCKMCMTRMSMAVSAVCCSQCTARLMLIREQDNAADTQPRARYCSRHHSNMLLVARGEMFLYNCCLWYVAPSATYCSGNASKHTAADTRAICCSWRCIFLYVYVARGATYCEQHTASNMLQYVAREDGRCQNCIFVCIYIYI